MKKPLHLDFESRSEVELSEVGLHNYWLHYSTRILMLGWAFGDEPVELWEPHLSGMPQRLVDALDDADQPLVAFNSPFERYGLQYGLKKTIPASRFHDPQASARMLSLPGKLDMVGRILGLPYEMQKDAEGEKLIKLFSMPHMTRKKKGEEQRMYFNDWESHPDQWHAFGEYCKRDVVAEREIARRLEMLQVYPLPERERKVWLFDQRVNDRGVKVDKKFVENAYKLASDEKKELIEKNNRLTGLENSNSNPQMLAWCQTQGYALGTLRKESVKAELDFNESLTPLCREVLGIRMMASSTTYKKLNAILTNVSPDGRLRNQFLYMGSSRCGRWSGNAVQLHNLARPNDTFEDQRNVEMLRALVYQLDYAGIKKEFGSVLLAVKNCIRTAFIAEHGKKLRIADLGSIETRVAAWLAGCQSLLQVFIDGRDAYLDFAMKIYGIPYETLAADIKSKDPAIKAAAKGKRQIAKPGVLGCVYRLGGGAVGKNKYGDKIKTGLWGYAENYGVKLEQEQSHKIVRIFRDGYQEIPQFWYDSERAVIEVMEGGSRMKRYLGPNDCIEISKIELTDRNPILRVKLPSGRYLHYVDAFLDDVKMPWKDAAGNDVYRKALCYSGIDQTTKQWRSTNTNGGKLLENWTQALSRDILTESLMKFEAEMDLPIVIHVHDEGVAENEDDGFSFGSEQMIRIMSEPIEWCPDLPLGADGFDAEYYHK